jgi:hypothetical protein
MPLMDVWWVAALLMALVATVAGAVFRLGGLGKNRPCVLPFGVAFLLLVLAVPLFDVSTAAGAALVLAAFVLGANGTSVSQWPPHWAKPRWLRERERSGARDATWSKEGAHSRPSGRNDGVEPRPAQPGDEVVSTQQPRLPIDASATKSRPVCCLR